jgi:hypothetical protein
MLDKDLIQKWLDKVTINNAQVEKMKGDFEPIKKNPQLRSSFQNLIQAF